MTDNVAMIDRRLCEACNPAIRRIGAVVHWDVGEAAVAIIGDYEEILSSGGEEDMLSLAARVMVADAWAGLVHEYGRPYENDYNLFDELVVRATASVIVVRAMAQRRIEGRAAGIAPDPDDRTLDEVGETVRNLPTHDRVDLLCHILQDLASVLYEDVLNRNGDITQVTRAADAVAQAQARVDDVGGRGTALLRGLLEPMQLPGDVLYQVIGLTNHPKESPSAFVGREWSRIVATTEILGEMDFLDLKDISSAELIEAAERQAVGMLARSQLLDNRSAFDADEARRRVRFTAMNLLTRWLDESLNPELGKQRRSEHDDDTFKLLTEIVAQSLVGVWAEELPARV